MRQPGGMVSWLADEAAGSSVGRIDGHGLSQLGRKRLCVFVQPQLLLVVQVNGRARGRAIQIQSPVAADGENRSVDESVWELLEGRVEDGHVVL